MKNNITVWTITEAYQDATDGNEGEISAYSEVFADKNAAEKKLNEWIEERIEEHYDCNDNWSADDTRKLIKSIYDMGEEHCGNRHYKWVNDYEHLAWVIQGHNI